MAGPERPIVFRRVVIGFRDACDSPAALAATVDLAHQLQAELLGIFVEDLGLAEWSASPLTRQLSARPQAETPFTPERLAREFAAAASVTRERLARAAARLGVSARFEIERGSSASLQLGAAQPEDLLVIVEPADPMARLSYPFPEVLGSVARATAPVLFVPRRVFQRHGPIVAITREPGEAAHSTASALAGAFGEPLVELASPVDRQGLRRALATLHERLIVFSRSTLATAEPLLFAAIAEERQVPTLVVGPGEQPAAEKSEPKGESQTGS